ncbi:MAG: ATP phosphoribosyltransferase regulatory subunit [Candidatus Obscuribacterales bacterium]|jgi:hypothetical protein|nr:ATP phosphoribosyltransferase regulatory subunit [Candidatus Obscuribacterales bacterium]
MNDAILERIKNELQVDDLIGKLSSLPQSDLNSLLLAIYKTRLSDLSPKELLVQSPVSDPCSLPASLIRTIENIAFDAAPEFENIELSPLVPLGTVNALADLDQGNVLSTLRAFELCSDPTSALALECAKRRKHVNTRTNSIRLCSSQRVVRFPLPKTKGFTSHFKLFAMVSAGRNQDSQSFEIRELSKHIETYIRFLQNCRSNGLLTFSALQVKVCDPSVIKELISSAGITNESVRKNVRAGDSESSERLLQEHNAKWPRLIDDPDKDLKELNLSEASKSRLRELNTMLAELRSLHQDVDFKIDLQRLTGIHYYSGPCFHIRLKAEAESAWQMVSDGGACPWIQKLLNDRKERLFTSAIGIELLLRLFLKM